MRLTCSSLGISFKGGSDTVPALRDVSFNAAEGEFLSMSPTNYGAGRLNMLREVYIPASLPHIFTGFRLAFGNALLTTIAVELVACPDGIGNMIWMAWQKFSPEKLFVGVIVSSLLGFLLHHLLERLETRVVPWCQT